MQYKLILLDKKTGSEMTDEEAIMTEGGLDVHGCGFEDFALQSDGTIVVMDKCGNFGYLDLDKYKVAIVMSR